MQYNKKEQTSKMIITILSVLLIGIVTVNIYIWRLNAVTQNKGKEPTEEINTTLNVRGKIIELPEEIDLATDGDLLFVEETKGDTIIIGYKHDYDE